ncbi:Hypothetical_protein [Hexamita inflata]|uniref:Hypothetical_protein n=1 Tax=Hexamita inflata TaxID=28002 RepID=A0AA86TSU1_9EUKA|nr:Hypothetical protein HINF_LOCUS8718 [Hexamita inflata]
MYNLNTQLSMTISQINSNLQGQIDGSKSTIQSIQSALTGINRQINNISSVNAVQNQDILELKNQTWQNMSSLFWCQMEFKTQSHVDRSRSLVYCPSLQLYCNYFKINAFKDEIYCYININYYCGQQTYSRAQCGQMIQIAPEDD